MDTYIVTSRTIDGTEYLGAIGWVNDPREAMLFSNVDAAIIADMEKVKAEDNNKRVAYGEGRYGIGVIAYVTKHYRLSEYIEAEKEAAQLDELYGNAE